MLSAEEIRAPAAEAPNWVKLLMMVSSHLTKSPPEAGTAPRIAVASPTSHHVPSAAALAALQYPDVGPLIEIEPGVRVATVLSKKFCDVKVSRIGERWGLNGITFDTGRKPLPPLVVLSDDHDLDRPDSIVPPGALSYMSLMGDNEAAEWTYQRLCLRPIVVLTNRPGQVISDMEDLAGAKPWWNSLQAAALVDAEAGSDWWFRRPIIVMTPAAALSEPWLTQLQVSFLVIVGFTAWSSPARHIWSDSPQMLVMNQRGSDIAGFREWFDGTEIRALQMPFGHQLRSAGLTLTAFHEVVRQSNADSDAGEVDEWDF